MQFIFTEFYFLFYLNADLNHRLETFSKRFGTYPVLTLIGKEIIVFAFSLINEKNAVVFPPREVKLLAGAYISCSQ